MPGSVAPGSVALWLALRVGGSVATDEGTGSPVEESGIDTVSSTVAMDEPVVAIA
jgi:hypothetical protein